MKSLFSVVIALGLIACGSSSGSDPGGGGDDDDTPHVDGGSQNTGGQHVASCSGVVTSGSDSNCPPDSSQSPCGDACSAYAAFVPGSSADLCKPGLTGSYGLYFKDPDDFENFFYEVIVCANGSPTQHACVTGYSIEAEGYDGNPGYKCL